MGQTRVDLLHLIEDLRDAYPGGVEETILVEIVANALDSGAGSIALWVDPAAATLTITDGGSGMRRRELSRYHDIAVSGKQRGQGIGFAGVGTKLGLLLCTEVLTETKQNGKHLATSWSLSSRHQAPWRWVPPTGIVAERGTAIRLKLNNPLSPLLDDLFLKDVLYRHYRPLFDPRLREALAAHYPSGVRFTIDGVCLAERGVDAGTVVELEIRLARRHKPSGVGYLVRHEATLPEASCGVAISTYGKVIKQGWDWLGITPAHPDKISGLIEVPKLAESLTLNKSDFIRSGPRGALYLAYRKAVQEAVSEQLMAWGDAREVPRDANKKVIRPMERDLEGILADMSKEFPLLTALVHRKSGGQKVLPIGVPSSASGQIVGTSPAPVVLEEEASVKVPPAQEPPVDTETASEGKTAGSGDVMASGRRTGRRPSKLGLRIQFENRPEKEDLGRLVESTVWVNEAHPAFRRAAAARSDGYHVALAVATTLASWTVEPQKALNFVSTFLARWGKALKNNLHSRRRRPRRESRGFRP